MLKKLLWSKVNKAVYGVVASGLAWLAVHGVAEAADPSVVAGVQAVIGGIVVYLIPNAD